MPILERDRQRIHYEEAGEGPAILLMHSFLCSGEMWRGQTAGLSRCHRVINVDLRGHGRSSSPDQAFTLYDLVEDAVAVLDEARVERAVWAGLSIGGMLALRAALVVPDRVRALVLVDSHAGAERPLPRLKYRAMGVGARLLGLKPLLPAVLPLMFGRTTRRENPELVRRWLPEVLAMELPSILRTLEALLRRDSVVDELGRIEVPALVLVGEEDRALPVACSREMARGLADARLQVIAKAGHLTALEQPEAVTRAMLEFLESLPAT